MLFVSILQVLHESSWTLECFVLFRKRYSPIPFDSSQQLYVQNAIQDQSWNTLYNISKQIVHLSPFSVGPPKQDLVSVSILKLIFFSTVIPLVVPPFCFHLIDFSICFSLMSILSPVQFPLGVPSIGDVSDVIFSEARPHSLTAMRCAFILQQSLSESSTWESIVHISKHNVYEVKNDPHFFGAQIYKKRHTWAWTLLQPSGDSD